MVDTGQCGARKTVISSPEGQQEVFDNFRERLQKDEVLLMGRLEIERKIKYWEKMRDFYTANARQKKRIQKQINSYKKLLGRESC